MTDQSLVTYASLVVGALCFILYIAEAAAAILTKPPAKMHEGVSKGAVGLLAKPGVDIGDATKLVEAIAKLTDSLSKAGPALTSLIGAILFFAIAAITSGALHSTPPAPDKPALATNATGK